MLEKDSSINISSLIFFLICFFAFTGIGASLSSIMIIILLCLIYLFISRTITFNRRILLCLAFLVFLLLKASSLLLGNYDPVSDYHSIIKVLKQDVAICIACIAFSGRRFDIHNKKNLFILVQILYNASVIVSILFLIRFGRNMYRDSLNSVDNILVAPTTFLLFAVLFSMFYMKRWLEEKRLIFLVLIAINSLYILYSNYTTQFVFSLFGIALVLVLNKQSITKKTIILFTLLLMIIVICVEPRLLANAILWIANTFFSNNEIISTRFVQLAAYLTTNNIQSGDVYGRIQLATLSLNSFSEHILIGIPFLHYNTTQTDLIVGGHMQWFDDLARYGVIGCMLRILVCINIWKSIYNNGMKISSLQKAMVIVLLLYGLFNPFISVQLFFVLFFIILAEKVCEAENENAKKMISYRINNLLADLKH